MKKTMRCKGFTITMNTNGTFNIIYNSKSFNKTWKCECKNFNDAGEWVWNMADNHDIGIYVNHKMCNFFNNSFFSNFA